ncbi:WbuC family cupin fold metalloprotein [Polynucleobacter sp. MWH-UH25E]|uniref:WbuC family cupin fold metalloprotein n=1 Tax=Polynucleobacter sp. MWH-UH25E TaxID=1855616 RepID=UPI001BFD68FB|nr:WbuC family cupin fold metalloprotein [Polynucleobacter sp. MWH-UH25E]
MEFLDNLSLFAFNSPRGRKNFNLHLDYTEPCQRLFNAIGVDSYIPPHRHLQDQKDETLIAVKGLFALIVFDEAGEIKRISKFGTEKFLTQGIANVGVELTPVVWHTVLALVEDSILLEVKSGPFIASAAKEMAPWAPPEDSSEAAHYFNNLKKLVTTK